MNPYFLAFSIYALLITPVTLHISVRIGKRVSYRLRVQAAGLPFIRRKDEEEPHKEQMVREEDVAKTLAAPGFRPLLKVLRLRYFRRLLRAARLESAYVHVRFSFDDAAATAMCYSLVRTSLATLARLKALPRVMTGRVEMDFQGRGTEVFVRGIIGVRLGRLGVAAIFFGAALLSSCVKRGRMEEETYAASH